MLDEAVASFRRNIYEAIGKVSNIYTLTDVHYEKLLCSLFVLSRCIEGMLFTYMTELVEEKQNEYKSLPVKNIEEIYAIIDANIQEEYRYNEKTTFLIMDIDKESYDIFENVSREDIREINMLDNLYRGTYVYDLYKKSHEEK